MTGYHTDRSLGVLSAVELNNTSAPRAAIRLVLNLRTLNLPDGVEQLNKVIVAGGPRKLQKSEQISIWQKMQGVITLRT